MPATPEQRASSPASSAPGTGQHHRVVHDLHHGDRAVSAARRDPSAAHRPCPARSTAGRSARSRRRRRGRREDIVGRGPHPSGGPIASAGALADGAPGEAVQRRARRHGLRVRALMSRLYSGRYQPTRHPGRVAVRTYVRLGCADAATPHPPDGREQLRWRLADDDGGRPDLLGERRARTRAGASSPASSCCTCGRRAGSSTRSRRRSRHALPLDDQPLPRLQPRVRLLLRPAHPRVPGPRHRRRLRPPHRGQGQRGRAAARRAARAALGGRERSRWAPTPTPTSRWRAATG